MNKPRILHIAPINTSGVPGQFVLTEREMGFDSRLATLYRDPRGYFEDICLDLPFIRSPKVKWIKNLVSAPEKLTLDNVFRGSIERPPIWHPHSPIEKALICWRDVLWMPVIERAIRRYDLDQFDVYQLDGGLGFYRSGRFVKKLKNNGKKIICCYTGSDLRTRGLIPAIDGLSDVNLTVEFDHLQLYPEIHHVFFPFDASRYKLHRFMDKKDIRIGHAPTNWKAKGSDVIVPVLKSLKGVKVVLIQGLTHARALELKQTCDIFVDQIGDLGYGINSLEALAMGIPTCSSLAPGFAENYPDHPFIVVNEENLRREIMDLLKKFPLLEKLGQRGREWVKKVHNAGNTVAQIHRLAGFL